jgi:hypothetical protein
VRPYEKDEDPKITDSRYCVYDEPHKDYLYTEEWVEYLVSIFSDYDELEKLLNSGKSAVYWEIIRSQ